MPDYPVKAWFGGSFDPVHNGHIRGALAAREALGCDVLHLLPCHIPPHKSGLQASAEDRLAMLRLALAGCPELVLDERELQRDTPSYTLETLHALRAEHPDASLVFVIGQDSLAGFHHWHRWQELLSLAHFAVLKRPQVPVDMAPEVAKFMAPRTCAASALHSARYGGLAYFDNAEFAVAASDIRRRLETLQRGHHRLDEPTLKRALPAPVLAYIETHGLYKDCVED